MAIHHLHLSVNKLIRFYWWEIKGNLGCLDLGVGNTRCESHGDQRMEPTFTGHLCVPSTISVEYSQQVAFVSTEDIPESVLGAWACSFNPHGSPFISIFTGETETERVTCRDYTASSTGAGIWTQAGQLQNPCSWSPCDTPSRLTQFLPEPYVEGIIIIPFNRQGN